MGAPSTSAGASPPPQGQSPDAILQFTFENSNGAGNIDNASVIINYGLDGAQACYLIYYPSSRALMLVNDLGTASAGTILFNADGWPVLPTPATVSNGQCRLDSPRVRLSPDTRRITLDVTLTADPTFKGAQKLYMSVKDKGVQLPPWQLMDPWSWVAYPAVPTAPRIDSLSPTSGSGSAATFTIGSSSDNGYKYLRSEMLIVSNFSLSHSCSVLYLQTSKVAFLMNDLGTEWLWATPVAAEDVPSSVEGLSGDFSFYATACRVAGFDPRRIAFKIQRSL